MTLDGDEGSAAGMSTSQARQLSVLWTKAHPIVAAFFRANVRDYHQADDLLQETAAAAAEKFTTYDPTRPFAAWALGIARNKLLEYWRRRASDPLVFDEATMQHIATLYADMEPELNVMQSALESCLAQVHGRPRRLLEMRYVRDLTPTMIANLTGSTANGVAVMLHRVRVALRACVERQLALWRRDNNPAPEGA